jgi:hypothetical protein
MTSPIWYPHDWEFGTGLDENDQPVKLTSADDADALTYGYCADQEAVAIKAGQLVRGKVIRERCGTEDLADELELVVRNRKRIRNCWRTPAYVWEIVAAIAGLKLGVSLITDPFFHPDAATARYAQIKMDGHNGKDGFDVTRWRGFALVNGPHSDSAKVAQVTQAYGEAALLESAPAGYGAALFAPYRGDKWFTRCAATAPIWVHLGRAACIAPTSVNKSGPPGCTIAAIWAKPDASKWTERLYNEGHYRLAVAPSERSKVEVLVTRGVPSLTYNLNEESQRT